MISPDIRIHILIESIWRNIAITLIELVSLILTQNSGKTVGKPCEEYCSERILPRKLADCGVPNIVTTSKSHQVRPRANSAEWTLFGNTLSHIV